jgi:hypothetical protein
MHHLRPRSVLRHLLAVALLIPLALPAADGPSDELLGGSDEANAKNQPGGAAGRQPQPDPADQGEQTASQRLALERGASLARQGTELVARFNQDPVFNATSIVDAAIAFGQARKLLIEGGADSDAIAAVQANLYWCKKQMNLDELKDYVAQKGDEFKAAAKQMDVVAAAPDPAQAGLYLERAVSFAKANASDQLQIAIRFTEVAERFPGSPEGTIANKRATEAVQAQVRALQEGQLAGRQTRFTKPKVVVAGATALPSAQAQKDAVAQVRKYYAKSYAKRDASAKVRLARRLLEETAKNRNDPAVFHQMACEAVRLASEAEAYEPLLDGIELLAGTFSDFDLQAEKQAALKKMSGKQVAVAISKLLGEPTNAEANLTAGKWFCLVARRWSEGLPMLNMGSDAELAKIAKMEIAGPRSGAEELQLADAWYDNAGKQRTKEDKLGMQARALYWYQKTVNQLDGLGKDRVVKRLLEIEKQLPLDPDSIDWNTLTATQWDKLKGREVVVNARVDRFDPGIALAAGEAVRVVPHPTDQWTIVLNGWISEGKKASCDWRGYSGRNNRNNRTYFIGGASAFNPGALLVWLEAGERRNAGVIKGPGRVYFSPQIVEYATGDRTGTIRVKLLPVIEED